MPSWFGLNLTEITFAQAVLLVVIYLGAWLVCQVGTICIHLAILALRQLFKIGYERVAGRSPSLHVYDFVEYKDESAILDAMDGKFRRIGYLYLLKPFVLTSKNKIALTCIITWFIAKFWLGL